MTLLTTLLGYTLQNTKSLVSNTTATSNLGTYGANSRYIFSVEFIIT